MSAMPPPTRAAALARIDAIRPDAYARTRNRLDGAVTGLSPYLTHGLVTLREVLAGVLRRESLAVQHKLVYELGWREFFRHLRAHRGDGILRSLHPGPRPEAAYHRELPADVREARTGVPAIDRAVSTLYASGGLHNHARMWLASYVVHVRHVHWRAGADWMLAHLLDGDLASNHLSWQWVAGTASHKPYLFNAENVARHAPGDWHSAGTVIDRSYEALERLARGEGVEAPGDSERAAGRPDGGIPPCASGAPAGLTEPPTCALPPPDLPLQAPGPGDAARLRGREVWLVHPWALRAPPADLADDAAVIGLYLREHHADWPWSATRWHWVDAAMAAVTRERWIVDGAALSGLLAGAARVRSVDDPHLAGRLDGLARLEPEPRLFPVVTQPCTSFSQWWRRTTRGLHQADALL